MQHQKPALAIVAVFSFMIGVGLTWALTPNMDDYEFPNDRFFTKRLNRVTGEMCLYAQDRHEWIHIQGPKKECQ